MVVVWPAPQRLDRIFTADALARLRSAFTVHVLEDVDDPEAELDALLPTAFAIVGQPDLPRERLDRAPELHAVLNVEGNFFPNVDYRTCHERGIAVLGCGPAYATAVAEYALGLALDLARGISREDRAFRAGRERYVSASTHDSILLSGADVGLIGFGNLGRALHRLLAPFRTTVRVYDPWLPDREIQAYGAEPASLTELLAASQFTFVLATVTPDSEHLLGAAELDTVRPGGAAGAGQPGRGGRLRRPNGPGAVRAVPGRGGRLAHRTDAHRPRGACAGGGGPVGAPRRRHPGGLLRHR